MSRKRKKTKREWTDLLFGAYDDDDSGIIALEEFAPLIMKMEPEIAKEDIRLTFLGAGGGDGLDKAEFYAWCLNVLEAFDDDEFEAQMKSMITTAAELTDNMARRRVLLAACDEDLGDGIDGMGITVWIAVTSIDAFTFKLEVDLSIDVPHFIKIVSSKTSVPVEDLNIFFRSKPIYASQRLCDIITPDILWSPESKIPDVMPEFFIYPKDHYSLEALEEAGKAEAEGSAPPESPAKLTPGASPRPPSSASTRSDATSASCSGDPPKPPPGANLVPQRYKNDLATYNRSTN